MVLMAAAWSVAAATVTIFAPCPKGDTKAVIWAALSESFHQELEISSDSDLLSACPLKYKILLPLPITYLHA